MTTSPIGIIARLASAEEKLRLAEALAASQQHKINELLDARKADAKRFRAIRRSLVRALNQLP